MSMEPELDVLRAAWTASACEERSGLPAGLRRRELGLRVRYILQLAFAAAMMGFAVAFVRSHFDFETLLWTAVVCITSAGAAAFQIWNWRGLLQTTGQSVAGYAEAYERRCHAMLRATRFGYRFLALQLAISTPWLTFDVVRGAMTLGRYTVSLGLLALITVAFLISFRRSRRRAMRELADVRDFRRGLTAVHI